MKNLIKKSLYTILMMWVVIMLTIVGKTHGQGLQIHFSVLDTIVCYGYNNGNINAEVNGGAPPYTYLWNTIPPQTTSHISGLSAGIYTVTVTGYDSILHKTDTAIASFTLHGDPRIVLTAHIDSIKCYGQRGSITLVATGGTPPYTYEYTDSPTSPTASNLRSGTYYFIVDDSYNCNSTDDSSDFKVTLNPLPIAEICYVEFDSATSKNSINWATNLPAMDTIYIFNEVSTNVWKRIGSVPASQGKFIDMNSNPYNQSYSYRISEIDTCEVSDTSAYQTTITLIVSYSPTLHSDGFTWSLYQGLTVPNYYIYGITNSGVETLIDSVPGTQYLYNYSNPNPAYVKYFVGFNSPVCYGSSSRLMASVHHLVKSNFVQATTAIEETAAINNMVTVYPNPVTDNLQIQTALQIKSIEITDITGRLLCIITAKTINCSSFAKGVYFIKATTEKGVVVKKFIKE
jgi:Secretion system C-terminal sorting domain/SprB repeat